MDKRNQDRRKASGPSGTGRVLPSSWNDFPGGTAAPHYGNTFLSRQRVKFPWLRDGFLPEKTNPSPCHSPRIRHPYETMKENPSDGFGTVLVKRNSGEDQISERTPWLARRRSII
jgi:hypothetical protein